MPKQLFCSECGQQLTLSRKAVSGTILDLVDPHTCTEEPVEPSITQGSVPTFLPRKPKGKFEKKLDELKPPKLEEGLRDRRDVKDIKTTAPQSVIDMLGSLKTGE